MAATGIKAAGRARQIRGDLGKLKEGAVAVPPG